MKYPNIYISISILFIIHHRTKHRNNKNLIEFKKWFQLKDVNNHESKFLFFLGIGLGNTIIKPFNYQIYLLIIIYFIIIIFDKFFIKILEKYICNMQ